MYLHKQELKQLVFIVCCLTVFSVCFSQNNESDTLKGKYLSYQSANLQEKIYVHTDKNFYLCGELIWFKIYCVDASFHKPLNQSKVAYIEILDKERKAVYHAKIALENGQGNGSFFLSSSTGTGNYLLRAYTNWMKNFSPEYYFEKEISIVNTLKRPDWKSLEKPENLNVRFFPEGGNLVYGIQSKVAFRLSDQYDRGVDCEGYVMDHNDTIARFRSLNFG